MITKHTTMTATPNALVIRIPWNELASRLRPKLKNRKLRAEDVLEFVERGRRLHAAGKTRAISSLADIR